MPHSAERCLHGGVRFAPARARHSGGAARGSSRPSSRSLGDRVVSGRRAVARRRKEHDGLRRAGASAQPSHAIRLRRETTEFLLDTALPRSAAHDSGRNLRSLMRTHCATAGTCMSAARSQEWSCACWRPWSGGERFPPAPQVGLASGRGPSDLSKSKTAHRTVRRDDSNPRSHPAPALTCTC